MTKGGYLEGGIPYHKLLDAVVVRRVGARLAMPVQPNAASDPKVMRRLQVASLR